MSDVDVIVIGGGLGGLSTGSLLAHQGRKVLVLEQSSRIGGCCSSFERNGYTFDVGASIVEIVEPIEKVFRLLGTTLQKELELIECDPIMSFIFENGERITYPLSAQQTGEIISKITPEDGKKWKEFSAFSQELMDVTLDTFFCEPASSMTDMLNLIKKNPKFLKFLPVFLTSYQSVLEKYFKNETVLKTMAYEALYFGLPPAIVPGPYAMVPYTEHVGVYYPKGGMIQIPLALKRLGEQQGMEVRMNSRVTKVLVENQKVKGVQLADGTEITCDRIVSDINAKTLYFKLIGEQYLPALAVRGMKSYDYSISVPMVYVAMDYEPPLDSHHSIIAISPEDLNRHYFDHIKTGTLANKNFGLICWSTHTDPSLAPKGQHILNIIPEGGYYLRDTNWDEEKPRFIERTIDNLSKSAIPGLKDHVVFSDCATPLDFERQLLLPEGAIYCLQQDLAAQAVFRPSARSKSISGLYLAGSSTHPGGGVPTTIASGLIASKLIAQDD